LNRDNVSKHLSSLQFTRKVLTRRPALPDVERQIRWWNNPPVGPIGFAGCLGVPTQLMVDIDECNITLLKCNPKYGHSKKGTRAVARLHGRRGQKRSLILAVDIVYGVVAFWLFAGTMDTSVWYVFLNTVLFPRLAFQQRVLIWDNLNSHLNKECLQACDQAGHMTIARPPHSPHFSFVEGCFSHIKNTLQKHYRELDDNNLDQYIIAAVGKITPQLVQGYAVGAHYFVEGRMWRPWQGD